MQCPTCEREGVKFTYNNQCIFCSEDHIFDLPLVTMDNKEDEEEEDEDGSSRRLFPSGEVAERFKAAGC